MKIFGTVQHLACPDCGASHPGFVFHGDTDMATDGLHYAGDREGRVICIYAGPAPAAATLFDGEDLREAVLSPLTRQTEVRQGESFAAFRERYEPARLAFHCPWCASEAMVVTADMTPDEFLRSGGTIRLADGLSLADAEDF